MKEPTAIQAERDRAKELVEAVKTACCCNNGKINWPCYYCEALKKYEGGWVSDETTKGIKGGEIMLPIDPETGKEIILQTDMLTDVKAGLHTVTLYFADGSYRSYLSPLSRLLIVWPLFVWTE